MVGGLISDYLDAIFSSKYLLVRCIYKGIKNVIIIKCKVYGNGQNYFDQNSEFYNKIAKINS